MYQTANALLGSAAPKASRYAPVVVGNSVEYVVPVTTAKVKYL